MKKLLLLLLFVTPIICFSQTSFSCDLKEFCDWNEDNNTWERDCNPFEDHSLFVMNKDETMFIHTTSTMKSTYYVKEKLSEEDNQFSYNVVSDVGNEYFYIFDVKNEEVKALTEDENGNAILVRWYVKSIF